MDQQIQYPDSVLSTASYSLQEDTVEFRFSDEGVSVMHSEHEDPGQLREIPRIFEDHLLKPVNQSPQPVIDRTPDWFIIIILVALAGVAYVRAIYPKTFKQIVRLLFNDALATQAVREENTLVQRSSVMLSFIFYITGALFLYQLSIYYNWKVPDLSNNFLRFVLFALLMAFAYSLKLVILKSLGWLFGGDRPLSHYIFNILLINNILGLVMLPVVLCIAFMDSALIREFIVAGMILALISFIYRLFRGMIIWRGTKGVSFFYLILYFCTLEIAPLLVVYRLAANSWY